MHRATIRTARLATQLLALARVEMLPVLAPVTASAGDDAATARARVTADPAHPYTQELLDSAPVADPRVQRRRHGLDRERRAARDAARNTARDT